MTDYNFQLKPAKKNAIPPLIGLWGKSGSGKTYSALLLARGIVGSQGTIAFIDTENGRALFYTDVCSPWRHLDLQPPFTPEKYTAAFHYCEQEGANIIIVDSMSHAWEGEGGVLDQADNAKTKSGEDMFGLAKWKAPKIAYKRMTNNLWRSPIPVIFCLRAADKSKQVGKGKNMEIIDLGTQPIAEKNFVFEMTVGLHLTKDGYYDLSTSKTIPEALRPVITEGGRITSDMGDKIAKWCGSGVAIDEEYLKLKRDGTDASLRGLESYTEWKDALTPAQKEKVKHHHSNWLKEAKAVLVEEPLSEDEAPA